jgi:hypothetical protein
LCQGHDKNLMLSRLGHDCHSLVIWTNDEPMNFMIVSHGCQAEIHHAFSQVRNGGVNALVGYDQPRTCENMVIVC